MSLAEIQPVDPSLGWTVDQMQRFMRYVKKTESCWVWTGATSGTYGSFARGRRINGKSRHIAAYRFSYEVHKGRVSKGHEIDHLCRNRLCVNPDHLEAVTRIVNCLRGMSPPAINARRTHCIRGHEFTETNTYRRKEGGRKCRICMRAQGEKQRRIAKEKESR